MKPDDQTSQVRHLPESGARIHPIDALRWYLSEGSPGSNKITASTHGLGRIEVVGADPTDERRGVPTSEFGGKGIVQPTQGAGARWLKRGVLPE